MDKKLSLVYVLIALATAILNQFQSGDAKRMEMLEERVTEHHVAIGAVSPGQVVASEQVSERLSPQVQVTNPQEPEPLSEFRSLTSSDVQNLEPEQNNVFNEGDLVEINVTRGNNDKTWNGLFGYIQRFVASTGKAVVLLQGSNRSKQFFKDELKLVEPVTTEDLEPTAVAKGAADLVPVQEVEAEAEAEPQGFQAGSSVEIVSDRHGSDLVWQAGIVTFANGVGCVVSVANKTVWFCNDELILIPATPQAAPEQEEGAMPQGG